MLQSRQLITHEHVAVGSKKITAPSYLVSVEEEPKIRLVYSINLAPSAGAKELKGENK